MIKVTNEEFISEQEYPKLRDIFQDLVVDYGIEGIYWFNEDNTGEIQVTSSIYEDIDNLIIDDEIKDNLDIIKDLSFFLKEEYAKDNLLISYK